MQNDEVIWQVIRHNNNCSFMVKIFQMYWPKFLVHKTKQRLTKMTQMQIRMRKLALKMSEKIMTTPRKEMNREARREEKAEKAAVLDKEPEVEYVEGYDELEEEEDMEDFGGLAIDETLKGDDYGAMDEYDEDMDTVQQKRARTGLGSAKLEKDEMDTKLKKKARVLVEVIPDSIGGLEKLEELNLSNNLLVSLPDSIGLLINLKILNVSANKLTALPDSISHCRSLVELDASFNSLGYLPTNMGYELVNLQRLSVHLNKLRSVPTSICEMKSLRQLDVHFNELRGLPQAIGRLTNLEILNLSNNFSDLTELPETFGDLINLSELDLSNNQIHALPDTFGQLAKLTKLNLEMNPLVLPPAEVVNKGIDAVKVFMAKRKLDMLLEEEHRSAEEANNQGQNGWLTRSTSWLNNFVTGYFVAGTSSPRDPYLDQQL